MKKAFNDELCLKETMNYFESEDTKNKLKLDVKDYKIFEVSLNDNVDLIRINSLKTLNKMNLTLFEEFYNVLENYSSFNSGDKVKILIGDKTNKFFCVGGDLVSFYDMLKKGADSFRFFGELSKFVIIKCSKVFSKNSVTIWNGASMGGGLAIGVYSEFRVATETSLLAMPEAKFGFFANCYFSNYISKFISKNEAMHMALFGHRFESYELYLKKFANFFILNKYIDSVISEIQNNPKNVKIILTTYHEKSTKEFAKEVKKYEDKIKLFETKINNIYNFEYDQKYFFDFYEKIKYNLSEGHSEFLEEFLSSSLHALKCNYNVIISAYQNLSFEEYHDQEWQTERELVLSGNMLEGIRAFYIDKDKKPRWNAKF